MAKSSSAAHGRQPAKWSAWNSFISLEWLAVNESLWKLQSPDRGLTRDVCSYLFTPLQPGRKLRVVLLWPDMRPIESRSPVRSQGSSYMLTFESPPTPPTTKTWLVYRAHWIFLLTIHSVSGSSSVKPPTIQTALLSSSLQLSRLSQTCSGPSSGHNFRSDLQPNTVLSLADNSCHSPKHIPYSSAELLAVHWEHHIFSLSGPCLGYSNSSSCLCGKLLTLQDFPRITYTPKSSLTLPRHLISTPQCTHVYTHRHTPRQS